MNNDKETTVFNIETAEKLEKMLWQCIDFCEQNPKETKYIDPEIWSRLLMYCVSQPINKNLLKHVFGINAKEIKYNPFDNSYIIYENK